jgi:hypothetical protein
LHTLAGRAIAAFIANALFYAGAANAAITMNDIEYATSFGWEHAGQLRACARFDANPGYELKASNVEVALLKFVRVSKLIASNYPEVQAGKVWMSEMVNIESNKGVDKYPAPVAIAEIIAGCKRYALDSEAFIKFIENLAAGKRTRYP